MSAEPVYLTTKETALRLRVNPETVRRWCRNGVLPGAMKIQPKGSSRYLIPETSVIAHQVQGRIYETT